MLFTFQSTFFPRESHPLTNLESISLCVIPAEAGIQPSKNYPQLLNPQLIILNLGVRKSKLCLRLSRGCLKEPVSVSLASPPGRTVYNPQCDQIERYQNHEHHYPNSVLICGSLLRTHRRLHKRGSWHDGAWSLAIAANQLMAAATITADNTGATLIRYNGAKKIPRPNSTKLSTIALRFIRNQMYI